MRRIMCCLMYAFLLLHAPAVAWTEDVTVTTYYPSPRGVYDELRTAGDVVIGDVATPAVARLQVEGGGILARGSVGNTPVAGDGTRLMWIPAKAAFRAGQTSGVRATDWDNANIGVNSVGLGANTKASGWASQALGYDVTASGVNAIAIGIAANATGLASITIGQGVSLADPLRNAQASSLAVGFISDLPTLFVGPSSGVGTTGNVGIGTSSPAAKLDIVQTGASDALRVQDQAADPTPFVIDVDGDVGIGTVPASAKLDIVQDGASDALRVQDQAADPTPFVINNAGGVGIKTQTVDPLVDLAIGLEDRGFRADSDSLVYHFDGKDMIWFTDSGKVGIGYEPGPGFFADIVVNDAIEVRTASNDDGQAAYYVQNTNVGWFWQIEHMLNGDYAFRNSFGVGIPVRARIDQNGNFYALSKNFDIPHPLDPAAKRLIHASVEGPETAVYYRGEGRLEAGRTRVRLPDYFEALTHPEGRTVQLTSRFSGKEPVSLLAASEVTNGSFDVRAVDDRNSSQAFYWEVKAVRADVAPLVVERPAAESQDAPSP